MQLAVVAILIVISCAVAPLIVPHVSYPLDRVLSRLIMVSVCVWLVFIMMRYEKNNWKRLGWERKDSRLELLLWGFGVAFLFLILFACLQAAFGSKKFLFQNLDQLTQKAFFYLLGAFVVGVLEEFLFRGVLFGVLRDRISTAQALFWTSFIYAVVHFLRTNDSMNVAHPTMMDSFKVLATLVEPFSQPQLIWQSFVGLFLLGLVLNHLFLKTNSFRLLVQVEFYAPGTRGRVFRFPYKKFRKMCNTNLCIRLRKHTRLLLFYSPSLGRF
jgi:membrane protease YdiL (CAAX protease family)